MQRKSCEYAHCSCLTVSAAGKGYKLEAHLYMMKEMILQRGNRSIGWWNQMLGEKSNKICVSFCIKSLDHRVAVNGVLNATRAESRKPPSKNSVILLNLS